MKTINHHGVRRALAVLAAGLALGGVLGTASGQSPMYRMQTLGPGGGVPAQAVQNSPIVTGASCALSWYGTEGWYTILGSTNMMGPWNPVTAVEATAYSWGTTLPIPDTSNNYSFFQLSQANSYASANACGGCHGAEYTPWTSTAHANAYNALVASHMNNNAECLQCHTTGYGQPTGYTDPVNTPTLEGVGCETCHGPAGWHRSSDHAVIIPAFSLDPEICGSCHNGYNPQYNEYTNSPHYLVEPVVDYGSSGGTYYTNTVTIPVKGVPTTLYGYYVTTNTSGAFVTNAASGIFNSSDAPGSFDPGFARQATCGICHSGASRMAMLADYNNRQVGVTNPLVLPLAMDAGAWGPTCANCHDPHALNPSPVFNDVSNNMVAVQPQYLQLRNPTWSSNFFTMVPTADERADSSGNPYYMNTVFAGLYNPSINVCGQCHNTRGARWDGLAYGLISNNVPVTNQVIGPAYSYTYITNYNIYGQIVGILTNEYATGGTVTNVTITNAWIVTVGLTTNVTGLSREPHLSPQYNMLIGILQPDYLNTTNGKTVYTNGLANNGMGIYATHSGITARSPYNTNQCVTCHVPSYSGPNGNVTGHTFEMDTHNCTICHSSGAPDWVDYQLTTTNTLRNVVALLNQWANDKAPVVLGAAYKASLLNSWEYTTPGSLASLTNTGPSTANQMLLPTNILQARFDAYEVFSDGSFGVHNPTFIPLLLSDAETKVLSQYPYAGFKANTVIGAPGTTGLKVTFTPQTTGLSSYTWNFGDGSTLTTNSASPVHAYTTLGQYTVGLSATNSLGAGETLYRTNYITLVQAAPTPTFTATPPAGTYPSYPLTVSVTNTTASSGNYVNFTFYLNGTSRGNSVYGVDAPNATYTMTTNGTYYVIETIGVGGSSTTTTSTFIVQ